jgi:hypothetical protein
VKTAVSAVRIAREAILKAGLATILELSLSSFIIL